MRERERGLKSGKLKGAQCTLRKSGYRLYKADNENPALMQQNCRAIFSLFFWRNFLEEEEEEQDAHTLFAFHGSSGTTYK